MSEITWFYRSRTTKKLIYLLKLRSLLPEDASAIQIVASDRSVADTTISIPHPFIPKD